MAGLACTTCLVGGPSSSCNVHFLQIIPPQSNDLRHAASITQTEQQDLTVDADLDLA